MALLETHGLTKRFGGLTAVNDVGFSVEEGEIVGLIGPNGAGKTTFVDLLTGVQAPTAGRILFRGEDVTRQPSHARSRLGLARTFQVPRPFAGVPIRENVMLGALFGRSGRDIGMRDAEELSERALERVGLGGQGDRPTGSLTTAGRKRLEVARCLAAEPSLLFLDEPLGGLNPTEVKEALTLIRELNGAGVTIVFIEHIMPAVMSVSGRVFVLADGRKLAEGTPQEIQASPEVQRAYLGDVKGAVSRYRAAGGRRG